MAAHRQRASVFVQLQREPPVQRALAAAGHDPAALGGCLADVCRSAACCGVSPLLAPRVRGRPTRLAQLAAAVADQSVPALAGLAELVFADQQAADAALRRLRRDPHVAYAHGETVKRLAADVTDPLADGQWALARIGYWQARAAAGLPDAAAVRVGVIDSGVDARHPDLDHARIVAVNYTRGAARDRDGHGTHVIGTIAALTNNAQGISGLCQPGQLVSFKVLEPFYEAGYYRALRAALEQRLDVVNLSLVGDASPTEERLIEELLRAGTILVAAMGNDGSARRRYPAAYPGVIAVGACGPDDELYPASNRGRHLDLTAPGVDILSTVPHYPTRRTRRTLYDAAGWSGTSMAAALVTATVVLLRARHPRAGREEIRAALHRGADPVPGQTGFDVRFGHGRLNLDRSLQWRSTSEV